MIPVAACSFERGDDAGGIAWNLDLAAGEISRSSRQGFEALRKGSDQSRLESGLQRRCDLSCVTSRDVLIRKKGIDCASGSAEVAAGCVIAQTSLHSQTSFQDNASNQQFGNSTIQEGSTQSRRRLRSCQTQRVH